MIDARDTALILEGGGMRNSYTAASIVHLLEKQVQFGWVGGVSAGASHTVNFLSGDKERARSSFTDFANNPSFGGLSHFLRGRGYFNAEFIYEKAADKDLPYDWETFTESSAQVCISATRADTGETVNWGREDMPSLPDLMMCVRASSTLPLIMPMRVIDGVPFVDGAAGVFQTSRNCHCDDRAAGEIQCRERPLADARKTRSRATILPYGFVRGIN